MSVELPRELPSVNFVLGLVESKGDTQSSSVVWKSQTDIAEGGRILINGQEIEVELTGSFSPRRSLSIYILNAKKVINCGALKCGP